MTNRLADATSPYLQQHKDNPVDWWPWCPEAFAEAARRDVPVFVSIGYAACHWCHVMAHESFEDQVVADALNARFVSIKVDREERPDVDAVYLEVTQALTGGAGWPMTIFATPSGEPFFVGTYFPRQARPGAPSFGQLLEAVAEAWSQRRDDVTAQASAILAELAKHDEPIPAGAVTRATLDAAVATLEAQYDDAHGGFGGAPKFPPSTALEFLLTHGGDRALAMADGTARAMAAGGIYDQLAGGFARYSVDAGWVVPHFEKMLYDNAQLLRCYAELWRQTGSVGALRVAGETADFLLADLRTAEGGFAASLDADTAGVEGATYVWTPQQLIDALGETDGRWAADLLGVTREGSFEHGTSVLQLHTLPAADAQRWAGVRAKLRAARDERSQPGRDDKVVTAWNGLAIAGLAETGALLTALSADLVRNRDAEAEPGLSPAPDGDLDAGRLDPGMGRRLLEGARAAADLLLDRHLVEGRLRRSSRGGRVGAAAGVLEDYANLAEGLLALHQATGEARWLATAGTLIDTATERFTDGAGGFYDTADDAEPLVRRPRDLADGPTPAGSAALARSALTYAALTHSAAHRSLAERIVAGHAALIARYPRAAGAIATTAERLVRGAVQVAVVGPGEPDGPAAPDRPDGRDATAVDSDHPAGRVGPADSELMRLVAAARRTAPPGAVLVAGTPDAPGVPLLADRHLVDGRATAYVCRDFVCSAPTTNAAELVAQLRSLR